MLVQSDIIKVHFPRTAGDCHIALSAKTNRYPVHITQNNALISQIL
jgi:hypothetical protein